ncbi:DUF5067 domain-containing protein [Microbacterium sp. Marseille-Q6965]|uniref:DUF5067 domain-containing protein n=1 Tax=Microbacterium sp. Marseille-Q6965 TaxID=2965072 RepID=UPI0021B7A2E3|nr:DUF5067 domain-containing protein [Microbacterium sp. Marseille-Q6965]
MRHIKTTLSLASFTIAALALAGCASADEEPTPSSTEAAGGSPVAEETNEPTFADSVLTTSELTITITDVKTIPVGEPGNEYGEAPVIAFWYDTTNHTSEDVSPMHWIYYFSAFQDNDPNAVNELDVAALPDDQFLNSQTETIKQGGTVANAVAYALTDTTTPVELVASADLGQTEIGSMTFTLD